VSCFPVWTPQDIDPCFGSAHSFKEKPITQQNYCSGCRKVLFSYEYKIGLIDSHIWIVILIYRYCNVRANFSIINILLYKICIKFDTFEKFALTLLYIDTSYIF
jgi:hypothetical protein